MVPERARRFVITTRLTVIVSKVTNATFLTPARRERRSVPRAKVREGAEEMARAVLVAAAGVDAQAAAVQAVAETALLALTVPTLGPALKAISLARNSVSVSGLAFAKIRSARKRMRRM